MIPDTKSAFKSKTLWINLLMAVLALFIPSVHDKLIASPEIMVGVFTVINVLLRFISKDKIQLL